jgi:hypothetical protein
VALSIAPSTGNLVQRSRSGFDDLSPCRRMRSDACFSSKGAARVPPVHASASARKEQPGPLNGGRPRHLVNFLAPPASHSSESE